MSNLSDTPRDALQQAAYEFALELVRVLEPDMLDGLADALSCDLKLELPLDGTIPRVKLDLTNRLSPVEPTLKIAAAGG